MITYSPPIDCARKALKYQGCFGPKALHTSPMSAHSLTGLSPLLLFGAGGAIFGPVRLWNVPASTQDTFLHVLPMEQNGTQTFILRQHSGPKPATDQRVGNCLWADTFLPIIQQQTIPSVIVAAAMYQPPDGPMLLIGHVRYHRSCSSLRWVWPSLASRSAVFFRVSTALMSSRISRIVR